MPIEWRPCPGFPNYAISSEGRIIRITPARNRAVGQEVGSKADKNGYRRVWLCRDGGVYARRVARLVCEAFHGSPPSPIHEAAHNDGSRTNDTPDNLRWATPTENQRDRVLHGTDTVGVNNPRAKLTDDDIRYIRQSRESLRATAAAYGVSYPLIGMIRRGVIWKHVA